MTSTIHEGCIASRKHPGNWVKYKSKVLNAVKFEDISPEETARQELPRISISSKRTEKATFCSPDEEWILPAASTINPEEREFVVDSRASVHMVSKKDLNKAELETVRISKNPMMVVTAKGEVQTNEEATVYVRELDS